MAKKEAHRNYAAALRPLIPVEAFRRRPQRLLYALVHVGCVALCCLASKHLNQWFWYLMLCVVAGHSLACLAFFSHELSHNAVMKRSVLRRLLEILLWGYNFIPATLWDEVHNRAHHLHVNTPRDPDRRFTLDQKTALTTVYSNLLYPSRQTLPWNPLVFVQFLGYISRNIISALSGGEWGMLPAAPSYTHRQRWMIVFELLAIFGIQFSIFCLCGFNLIRYLFLGPGSLMVASAVVMAYVFTNHFLNPLHDENDPVASSTSVVVPKLVDWLHCHFSYHTEHHLFPAMDSRFYPIVSRELSRLYPEDYNRISFRAAWRQLWMSHAFDNEKVTIGDGVKKDDRPHIYS
jgi:fatty acid desaturase